MIGYMSTPDRRRGLVRLFAKSFGEAGGALDDFGSGVRRDRAGYDSVLKIDEEEGGLCGVEMKWGHGSPEYPFLK